MTSIFYVEKELGMFVDEDYPLMKFLVQVEELNKHVEREKKKMEKSKRGIGN